MKQSNTNLASTGKPGRSVSDLNCRFSVGAFTKKDTNMKIGIYKSCGYSSYALLDTLIVEDDAAADASERKYSSACCFLRSDDDEHSFKKTVNATQFED